MLIGTEMSPKLRAEGVGVVEMMGPKKDLARAAFPVKIRSMIQVAGEVLSVVHRLQEDPPAREFLDAPMAMRPVELRKREAMLVSSKVKTMVRPQGDVMPVE